MVDKQIAQLVFFNALAGRALALYYKTRHV